MGLVFVSHLVTSDEGMLHIPRVEVPDGSYTLVPADEDEGAGRDVHYVTVEQDPDQSSEGCLSACADEASPGLIINLCVSFKTSEFIFVISCAFTFRS
jgi:hypothetical protein